MLLIGIDLAWGDRKPDGVCCIEAGSQGARIHSFAYPQGDIELLRVVQELMAGDREAFLTVDAPIICPNRTGTRPVDRLTHTMFHREHAACHPANSTKCPRPPRVRRKLARLGIQAGWDLGSASKLVAEVYPHPAMVRMLRIPRIVKYKKGPVENRRSEFQRLQRLMKDLLKRDFPELMLSGEAKELLSLPWTKPVEDRTDALFCALIGLWHWKPQGTRSEVIGNLKTGFILLPAAISV